MTGDELAAALYAEQGYMVLWSREPLEIGSITDSEGDCTAMLRIVRETNVDEYVKQSKRARELEPSIAGPLRDYHAHYYHVEALD